MTDEQQDLLQEAKSSLRAAELLHGEGFHAFAASRAYYAMFYAVEALLEGEGESYSTHSAVIAAFGKRFAKTGRVSKELHRHLIEAAAARHEGDYAAKDTITAMKAVEHIARARRLLIEAENLLRTP